MREPRFLQRGSRFVTFFRRFNSATPLWIVIVSLIAFSNSFGNELVAGDVQFILNNPSIRDAGVLTTAFSRGYWWVGASADAGTYYRPLLVLLDAFDFRVWGESAAGYHLTNILLHCLVCVLVHRLACVWTRSRVAAAIAATVFAVHPIHVFAVTYVSARSALLCTVFYVGAVLAALGVRTSDSSRDQWFWRSLVVVAMYVGALLSLESAITLPIVVATVLLWPRESLRSKLPRATPVLVGLALVSVAYFVARQHALGSLFSKKESLAAIQGPLLAILNASKLNLYYFEKMVFPHDLSYLPPFVPVVVPSDVRGVVSSGLLVAQMIVIVGGPLGWWRERAALAWVTLTVVPVCGLFPLDHFVKGQYAYLPSVAICVLFGLLVRRALRFANQQKMARIFIASGVGIVIVSLIGWTLVENRYWRNESTLWARALELEPKIPNDLFPLRIMTPTANRFAIIHVAVAADLANQKRCVEAQPHIERALDIARSRRVKLDARRVHAHCLFISTDVEAALAAYVALLADLPDDRQVLDRLVTLSRDLGRVDDMRNYLRRLCQVGVNSACLEPENSTPEHLCPFAIQPCPSAAERWSEVCPLFRCSALGDRLESCRPTRSPLQ